MKKTSIIAAVTAALTLTAGAAYADVKCAGTYVPAGKNDCKAGAHSCAGHSTAASPDEWKNQKTKEACDAVGGKVID